MPNNPHFIQTLLIFLTGRCICPAVTSVIQTSVTGDVPFIFTVSISQGWTNFESGYVICLHLVILVVFKIVLSGVRDYSLRAELILLKGDRVEWWMEQGGEACMQKVISMQALLYVQYTTLDQRAVDTRETGDAAHAESQSYNLRFRKTRVQHCGKSAQAILFLAKG